MNIGKEIKKALKQKGITVTKASNIIGCTRPTFYNKLENGNFFYCELHKLQTAGIIDIIKEI